MNIFDDVIEIFDDMIKSFHQSSNQSSNIFTEHVIMIDSMIDEMIRTCHRIF